MKQYIHLEFGVIKTSLKRWDSANKCFKSKWFK